MGDFKTYKTWDTAWKRQYLDSLKSNASLTAPRQKFVPIVRESDGVLIAYLEVRHPTFPTPVGKYVFSNDSWLCDMTKPHRPITVMMNDYYGTDRTETIKRSANVLTGNRYYYDSSESWVVSSNQKNDKLWEEIWRMSPRYREWKNDASSTLNVTVVLNVFLSDHIVQKLRQASKTQTNETDPVLFPVSFNKFENKILRDDVNQTITYIGMFTFD